MTESSTPHGPTTTRTSDEIQNWIAGYIAKQLSMTADEIDVNVPFDDFALDSATAIEMTGELEDWLGKSVDPMLVYDYPTIADLADHLAR